MSDDPPRIRTVREVEWGSYEYFNFDVTKPFAKLSSRKARAAFGRLMKAIPLRLRELRTLLATNGVDMDDLGALHDWYVAAVQESHPSSGHIAGIWDCVACDIGMLLGELLVGATNGALRWEMVDGPKDDIAFQEAVIRGFAVPDPTYYEDYMALVAMYGERIVRGEPPTEGFFESLIVDALSKAPAV